MSACLAAYTISTIANTAAYNKSMVSCIYTIITIANIAAYTDQGHV